MPEENGNQAVAKKDALEVHLAKRLGTKFGIPAETVKGVMSKILLVSKKDKPVTTTELVGFMIVCDQYGLNPFVKQIHAFVGKNGKVAPIVGIDGWVSIVNRQKSFDGSAIVFEDGENDKPVSATCTMHLKNRKHPVIITERYSECHRQTDPWNNMPYRMLRHKAYIQCARIAFGLAGMYESVEEAEEAVGEGAMIDLGQAEVISSQPLRSEPKSGSAEDALLAAKAQASEGGKTPEQPQEAATEPAEAQNPPSEAPKAEQPPPAAPPPQKAKNFTPKQRVVRLLLPLAMGNIKAFNRAVKQALGGKLDPNLAPETALQALTQKQLEAIDEAFKNPKPGETADNGGVETPSRPSKAATGHPEQQKSPSAGSEPKKTESGKKKSSGADSERPGLVEFIKGHGSELTNKIAIIQEVCGSDINDQALADMAENPELIEDTAKLRSVKNILTMMAG